MSVPTSRRRTLGTDYNLRPRTERVLARDLHVGDVVMESDDHPAQITNIRHTATVTRIWARYIWQASREPNWSLGDFESGYPFSRAKKGQY